jgi:hypothetical protein
VTFLLNGILMGSWAVRSIGTGTVALAPSLPVLCALLFAMGAAHGSLDVAMNAHGVAVERSEGERVAPCFGCGAAPFFACLPPFAAVGDPLS